LNNIIQTKIKRNTNSNNIEPSNYYGGSNDIFSTNNLNLSHKNYDNPYSSTIDYDNLNNTHKIYDNPNPYSDYNDYDSKKKDKGCDYDDYLKSNNNMNNPYNNLDNNRNNNNVGKFEKIRDMNLKIKQIKNDGYYNLNLTPRNSSDKAKPDEDKNDFYNEFGTKKDKVKRDTSNGNQPKQPIEYESRRKNKNNLNIEKGKLDVQPTLQQTKNNQSKNTLIQVKQDMNEIFESRRNIEYKI